MPWIAACVAGCAIFAFWESGKLYLHATHSLHVHMKNNQGRFTVWKDHCMEWFISEHIQLGQQSKPRSSTLGPQNMSCTSSKVGLWSLSSCIVLETVKRRDWKRRLNSRGSISSTQCCWMNLDALAWLMLETITRLTDEKWSWILPVSTGGDSYSRCIPQLKSKVSLQSFEFKMARHRKQNSNDKADTGFVMQPRNSDHGMSNHC